MSVSGDEGVAMDDERDLIPRNGAVAFVASMAAAGVRHVFGNPGTTEQSFLQALAGRTDMEFVLSLHESVAVGAAEGFARVSGSVAAVQLHSACGLGNAMGMINNAMVGHTPMVIYVGVTGRTVAHTEPILGGDIVAMAAPATKWAWEIRSAKEIPTVVARAFKIAASAPAGPVVLAVPNDVMEEPCSEPIVAPSLVHGRTRPEAGLIQEIADAVIAADNPVILIGDGVAGSGAGEQAAQLAGLIGAPIYGAYLTESVLPSECLMDAGPLPLFDSARARSTLGEHDLVLAIGTGLLRSVFPSPGPPLGHDANVIHIGADPWELGKNQSCLAVLGDEKTTLQELLTALDDSFGDMGRDKATERTAGVAATIGARRRRERKEATALSARHGFSSDVVIATVAAAIPERSIVVDESVSAMASVKRWIDSPPGRWFRSRGGGLGAGMTLPIGAALAAPDHPVVAIVGDGSMMYTSSAIWTAVCHRLPILWIVLDNGGYRILEENARKFSSAGASEERMIGTDLSPRIALAELAGALGLACHHNVGDTSELRVALETSLKCLWESGPALIQARVDG
jgi:benzoylformate decarboxylase